MSKQLPDQIASSFSDDDTRRILARAADLDRLLAGRLSASAIREAAMQAGISEDAIEQAIREARGNAPAGSTSLVRVSDVSEVGHLRHWARHAMALGLGGTVGVLAGAKAPAAIYGNAGMEFAIGGGVVIAALSLLLASESRGSKAALRYQFNNLLLWFGFAMGAATLLDHAFSGSDGVELIVVGGVVSGLVGAGIIWLRNRLSLAGEWRGGSASDGKLLRAT